MPSNFTSTIAASIINNDGSKLVFAANAVVSNGKLIKDDVVVAGTYDLAPLLSDLTTPQYVLIIFGDPTGFTVSQNGGAHSTQKYLVFFVGMQGGSAVDLEIITTAPGRLQVYAIGDPT